ncbi:MAG: class I SAM-dependent methyltransferase [Elusimicrobiota bacterium]|jgi:SAM-dependent methyltransferase|nr:class I SAM-dependent methyltransferase [Elusimicrobiota bacterium]
MFKCRFCQNTLEVCFADLNTAPIVNNYIAQEDLYKEDIYYPLKVFVCSKCHLVQTIDFNPASQIFHENYAYFSSYSNSWLKHCQEYVDMIIAKLSLNQNSFITEIASNDGYLLQYFKEKNIQYLGIEPCKSVAESAKAKGINTLIEFFNLKTAKNLQKADLICMSNVLAHIPDINDFTAAITETLKPKGTLTIEFPHLLNIIKFNQFDTIYLEHYSYLSLLFLQKLFDAHNLRIYDIEELNTHGGSLRIYGAHRGNQSIAVNKENIDRVLKQETDLGLDKIEVYKSFNEKMKKTKRDILSLLNEIKNSGKSIAAFGASAKGNTLFNYCGISTDYIDYSVDDIPYKQNKFLPGSRIPVKPRSELIKTKPDYIFITPWNFKDEIIGKLEYAKKDWGAKFIIPIPKPEII